MMLTAILIGLFLVFFLVLPTVFSRQAVLQVISIFREHEALCSQNAKTVDELGLRPAGLAKRLISFRDYKPQALGSLIKANIVQVTEDNKLFLAEDKIVNLHPFRR
ncbi:MAG: hypothetical protein AB1427_03895 [Thermodesulfobacteriota bacterium]